MKKVLIYLFFLLLGCTGESPAGGGSTGLAPRPQWSIPEDLILDGGVGKDGIPAIESPQFSPLNTVNSAFDEELVLGIIHGEEIRAYPIPILDWHEVVNDRFGRVEVSITYCPLTGTGIGWQLPLGEGGSFGVSGLLYNSNLMPYDRRTNSTWSQMLLECVNGLLQGRKPTTFTLIETSFKTWKKSFPNSLIMNANTGFDRRYSIYPYGDYRSNQERLLFPISQSDNRLKPKERVRGVIIDNRVKVYPFIGEDRGVVVFDDDFAGKSLIIAISNEHNFIAAFYRPEGRGFTAPDKTIPAIMVDEKGNSYNLAGQVIDGPDLGQSLASPTSLMGYWLSWPPFYTDIEIYSK